MAKGLAQDKARLAVFDFDGTVIDGQSGKLISTYLFRKGQVSPVRAARLLWWGIRYKLHLPQKQSEARELVFGALRGCDRETVDGILRTFHSEVLRERYRPKAIREIARRKDEGCIILLVSATFKAIAEAAAQTLGCDGAIATEMEVDANGNYTGHVDGNVVEGEGKLAQVRAWADEHLGKDAWTLACAYGDHYSDECLLEEAAEAYAVCPGPALKKRAKKKGWAIFDWDEKSLQ